MSWAPEISTQHKYRPKIILVWFWDRLPIPSTYTDWCFPTPGQFHIKIICHLVKLAQKKVVCLTVSNELFYTASHLYKYQSCMKILLECDGNGNFSVSLPFWIFLIQLKVAKTSQIGSDIELFGISLFSATIFLSASYFLWRRER